MAWKFSITLFILYEGMGFMNLTTVLGIIVGVGAVIVAMILKHIPFTAFANPAAFTIIFAGTVATILNSYSGRDLKDLGKLFKLLFSSGKHNNTVEIINTIYQFSVEARKDGLLSLESKVDTIDDPFMKKGLKMVIDGASDEYVVDVLTIEIESMKERHATNAGIFSSAGMYAPTLGVLGAVFGLIASMAHIEDVEMMSEAIAAAFMATILGIFTGYVLWNPFATKLKTLSKHEVFEKFMVIEGLVSLQKGDQPARIKEKLVSMLPEKQQALIGDNT